MRRPYKTIKSIKVKLKISIKESYMELETVFEILYGVI